MTVHFFTYSNEQSGSSRQRAFKIAEELNARGVHAVVHRPSAVEMSRTHWPKKGRLIIEFLHGLASVKRDDILYIQRAISNKYVFVLLTSYVFLFRRKMIFDIDDPIYVHSFLKTKILTQMADAVVVCHHVLADWAKQYNRNVYIVHISLTMGAYEKFTHDYTKEAIPMTLGWVGDAPEHIRNLAVLAPVLKRLLHESPIPFRFVLIGALQQKRIYDLFAIPGLDVRMVDTLPWSDPEAVPREIQKFDIGVQPYELANPLSKTKTSFKIIEYMACGVAVISTPFGEMPYILTDGVNGFLAETEDEWVEKLKQLLADKALRARLGRAGQERVREAYSFDAIMPRMITIVRSVGGA